jgi:hypothetical protein
VAAGNTYVPIATQTISTSVAEVTFASISSAYTDLVLVCSLIDTSNNQIALQVGNGSIDTGSNYSNTRLTGNGTTASSARNSAASYMYMGVSGTVTGTYIFNFQNYANTTTYKTVLSRTGHANYETTAAVGLWRSTSAINTIKLYGFTNINPSTISLYGILAA